MSKVAINVKFGCLKPIIAQDIELFYCYITKRSDTKYIFIKMLFYLIENYIIFRKPYYYK